MIGKKRKKTRISQQMQEHLSLEFSTNNIEKNGKLLVLFLFNTSDEMRLLRMHPEVLIADTTHGTNREKKDGDRKY